MTTLRPLHAIELLGIIARLDWRKLTSQDYMLFADAGPDARIAEISATRSGEICEMLDLRSSEPLLAVIGGDALQIEICGVDDEGSPICATIALGIDVGC